MTKERKLVCTIHESETKDMYLVKSTLVDGTPFEIKTPWSNVVFKDEKNQVVPSEGWLKVKEFGVQGNRATIDLPSPSIVHGKKVCVDTANLV
jgi:hypothetical protein